MKVLNAITSVFCFALVQIAPAQDYSFSPEANYAAELNPNEYSIHQIDIFNNSADTVYMSWRLVGNSCPEQWDFALCDWAACYDYMPNTGDMEPVAPGEAGWIKITVNPFDDLSTGTLDFWVFPTGNMAAHVDFSFTFNPEVLHTNSTAEEEYTRIYPQPVHDFFMCRMKEPGVISIIDLSGRTIESHAVWDEYHQISIGHLPSGVYIVQTPQGNQRISIIH